MARMLPAKAKMGVLLPPRGDGYVTIDDQLWRLAPTAQFRNGRNLIVMPMQIQSGGSRLSPQRFGRDPSRLDADVEGSLDASPTLRS
jgi:hypothetical protein